MKLQDGKAGNKNRIVMIAVIIALMVMVATFLAMVFRNFNTGASLEGVAFLEDTITIEKSETYTISLIGAEDKEIKWKSEDESKATVIDGVVYAKKKGNTKIYASIGKSSISCNVIVADNKYVPTIELNEPDDGISIEKEATYSLNPVLYYNGKAYTDAEYTYSADGDVITVDKTGKVSASDLGEGMVCIKAEWRDNVVETSVPVQVIDASTSIEVCDKKFEIYLNGEGGAYPGQADLGITVFDNNIQVQNYGSSVSYVEKVEEGDLEGAATIRNGVVSAKKIGTTHYVAEYKTDAGMVVRSTNFQVDVLQTPADKYMTAIKGNEFTFFWEPLGTENSVEWIEELQAFHLINKATTNNDARGFVVNKEYLSNIIQYTKAESISFEFKTDGVACGANTNDKGIYQGFYPDWYEKDHFTRTDLSDKWTKIEIFFDDIPVEDEIMKTIFLMNTVEGIYVRNVRLYLPGEDRTDYDASVNYLADIKGTDYEFFIEPLGNDNAVKWDANLQAYHLINKVTVESNTRGFIFNQDYFTNIIKHTTAESVSFEFKTDGIATGIDTKDKHIYQGFYPDWWDADNMKVYSLSDEWTRVEIFFDAIPKDEKGNVKTVFLMNTTEGMYIRNIKLYQPGEERPADEPTYNPDWDYTADIKGTDYEFFIEPLGDDNSVKWDANLQAYHLINKVTVESNTRGFVFNKAYLQGIMNVTEGESISFEYKTDGKASGLNTKDKHIYQGYWPNWYVKGEFNSVAISENWTTVTINFADLPKDTDGSVKTIFLMNTTEGMYVRNIKVNVPTVDEPAVDEPADTYPSDDYLADIKGKDYEFFIQPLGADNSVSWDAEKEAYHLTNLVNAASNTRGFIFDKEYLQKVITETEAVSISFEYKTDGKASGLDTKDKHIYQGYWPNWYVTGEFSSVALSEDWTEKTIMFSDIPKDTDGSIKTVFLMNTIEGMYVRNIKVNSKKETINLADTNHTWSAGELYGSNGTGTFSRNDNIVKIAGCSCYASRAVKFADATTVYAKNLKIRFKMRATSAGNPASTSNLKIHFFNYKNKSGKFGTDEYAQYTFTAQDNWETVELDLGGFLDDNGHFTGFAFGMSNYGNHQTGERYTIEFDQIEIF